MNALEFLAKKLSEAGYDGLCKSECGCENDDLAPCESICNECVPARKAPCDGSCECPKTCKGHMVPAEKEDE